MTMQLVETDEFLERFELRICLGQERLLVLLLSQRDQRAVLVAGPE